MKELPIELTLALQDEREEVFIGLKADIEHVLYLRRVLKDSKDLGQIDNPVEGETKSERYGLRFRLTSDYIHYLTENLITATSDLSRKISQCESPGSSDEDVTRRLEKVKKVSERYAIDSSDEVQMISFNSKPGISLTEILEKNILMIQKAIVSLNHKKLDDYLGAWTTTDSELGRRVKEDLVQIYKAFHAQKIAITPANIYGSSRGYAPEARAVISLFLERKYRLSLEDRAKILGKTTLTVAVAAKKFYDPPTDVSSIKEFVETALREYSGKKTKR